MYMSKRFRTVLLPILCWVSAAPFYTGLAQALRPSTHMINVREHGVRESTPSDRSEAFAGTAIESLMKDHPGDTLYFPAGDYLLANNTNRKDGLVIGPTFHGSLVFASGARLVCNTVTPHAGTCVHFLSASNVSVLHLDIEYLDQKRLPMNRAAAVGYALLIDSSSNIQMSSTTIEASPGACFWASNSTRLTVHDIHVSQCTADGVHFENDRDVDLQDMWSLHTLDDGLAFTNVAVTNPNCGAVAKGIHIEDSATRGIAVPGGCGIAVSHFSIDRTGVSGILVNTDGAFHMRRPQTISFQDGVISNAGVLSSSSGGGNKFGIEVSAADHVSFEHVQVVSAASRGFDVSHGATSVSLNDSVITGSGDNAMNLMNSSDISVSQDVIQDAAGYGTYLSGVSDFKGSHLTYINVSTRRSGTNLHRVFWVDNPAGTTRQEFLKIIDNQPIATGYIVGCSDVVGHPFSITGLSTSIRQGSLKVECAGEVRQLAF